MARRPLDEFQKATVKNLLMPCGGLYSGDADSILWSSLLRLLFSNVGHRRTSELVGRFDFHRFAIFGNCHKSDDNNFSILFVGFFNSEFIDQSSRRRGVAGIPAHRIVFAIEFHVIRRTTV